MLQQDLSTHVCLSGNARKYHNSTREEKLSSTSPTRPGLLTSSSWKSFEFGVTFFVGICTTFSSNHPQHFFLYFKFLLDYFSSHQWKGGGIDGRVRPRTGTSDRIVLVRYVGHTSRLRLVWEYLLLLVLLKTTLGGGGRIL